MLKDARFQQDAKLKILGPKDANLAPRMLKVVTLEGTSVNNRRI